MMRHIATAARARALACSMATLLGGLGASPWLAGCSDDEPSGAGAAAGSGASGSGASGSGGAGGGAAAGGSGGAPAGSGGGGGAPVATHPYVYVGQGNGEIAVFDLDRQTGVLTPLSTVDAGANPSFLAISPDERFVYAVLEGGDAVAAFTVDPDDAHLTPLGDPASSQGNGPAHVSVDQTGKWVFAANYGSGTVAVLPVQADGSLGAAVDTAEPGQNSHLIRSDPSNDFVFVPNKGSDTVSQFLFDDMTGQLDDNDPPAVDTANGAGPRHLDFHPSLPIVYVINEIDDTLSVYDFDAAAGTLSDKQTLSTLPDGVDGDGNSCADVHVSVDGKYVFGSNRGHDSIVVFEVNPGDGTLTLVEHEPTGGQTPRNFAVDPAGGLLLVANQGSDQVVPMTIDAATGALTALPATDTDGAPAWVGVIELPVLSD